METTDSIRSDIYKLMESTNKSLNMEISDCRRKLANIQRKKALVEKKEVAIQDILSGFMSTKHCQIWRIRCKHSICEHHYSGVFSSEKKAKRCIPSHNFCTYRCNRETPYYGCIVKYTVESIDSSSLNYKQWETLDTDPFSLE